MNATQIFTLAALSATLTFTACSEAPKTNETAAPVETAENKPLTGNLTIDHSASTVGWRGEMIGGLYGHNGTIAIKESNLTLKDGKIENGNFTIDMNTISPTDKNYNPTSGKTPEKLVGHLTTADFFDTANHPTASFAITSIEGDKAIGKLTVRGVTNDETIENITITPNGETISITGKLNFDRQKYGVAYATGSKDNILSDNIALDIQLTGKL